VAVHIAVGKQADEVDYPTSGLGPGNDLLPGSALPYRAGGNGLSDQRSALAVNLACTDGIVTDLGIAHVFVGRHADSGAMGAQGDVRVVGEKMIEGRLSGSRNRAADIGFGNAVAIHDDRHDRALNTREKGRLLQHDGVLGK